MVIVAFLFLLFSKLVIEIRLRRIRLDLGLAGYQSSAWALGLGRFGGRAAYGIPPLIHELRLTGLERLLSYLVIDSHPRRNNGWGCVIYQPTYCRRTVHREPRKWIDENCDYSVDRMVTGPQSERVGKATTKV